MSKTGFSKDQPVDFRLSADSMWWRGGRYMHLVPGPASEDPWVRVRSKAGSVLAVHLSDIRPLASIAPLADILGRVDRAQASARSHMPDGSLGSFPLPGELTALRELAEGVREHLMWCRELKEGE
jgi:hypothetical protein